MAGAPGAVGGILCGRKAGVLAAGSRENSLPGLELLLIPGAFPALASVCSGFHFLGYPHPLPVS